MTAPACSADEPRPSLVRSTFLRRRTQRLRRMLCQRSIPTIGQIYRRPELVPLAGRRLKTRSTRASRGTCHWHGLR